MASSSSDGELPFPLSSCKAASKPKDRKRYRETYSSSTSSGSSPKKARTFYHETENKKVKKFEATDILCLYPKDCYFGTYPCFIKFVKKDPSPVDTIVEALTDNLESIEENTERDFLEFDLPTLNETEKNTEEFIFSSAQIFLGNLQCHKNRFWSDAGTLSEEERIENKNSHKSAVLKLQGKNDFEKTREAAFDKNKSAIISAMKNVLFVACHNLPNSLVPDLNALCIDQGAQQLNDLRVDAHTTYEHHGSIQSFQQSLASVARDDLVGRVGQSGVFSILVDESTDVSVHQNMVVYVRFLEEVLGRFEPKTLFLGIRQLTVATADGIKSELLALLSDMGLAVDRMVGVATDGASVMVGCRSGLVTQLKAQVPGLLATHCVAHRLALCCGQAADKVRYLVKFQEILNSLFKYFENSPKNMNRLEAVQAVLELSGTKLRQVFHTRWLSFDGAVRSVLDNFSGLVSVFLEDGSAKALSMHKPITSVKFLYTLHFLVDVLKHLATLCKAYQRYDLDFTEVNSLLESTVDVLLDLRDNRSGSCFRKFLDAVPTEPKFDQSGLCTFEFSGHTIRDGSQQRSEARTSCEAFVSQVVDNLQARFSDKGDAKVMMSLSELFRPSSVLSGVGEDVLDSVVEYLVSCGIAGCKDVAQKYQINETLEKIVMIGFSFLLDAFLNGFSNGFGRSAIESIFKICSLIPTKHRSEADYVVNLGGGSPRNAGNTTTLQTYSTIPGDLTMKEAEKQLSLEMAEVKVWVPDTVVYTKKKGAEIRERIYYMFAECKSGNAPKKTLYYQLWHESLCGLINSDVVYSLGVCSSFMTLCKLALNGNVLETHIISMWFGKRKGKNELAKKPFDILQFRKFIQYITKAIQDQQT